MQYIVQASPNDAFCQCVAVELPHRFRTTRSVATRNEPAGSTHHYHTPPLRIHAHSRAKAISNLPVFPLPSEGRALHTAHGDEENAASIAVYQTRDQSEGELLQSLPVHCSTTRRRLRRSTHGRFAQTPADLPISTTDQSLVTPCRLNRQIFLPPDFQ